jgi:N-acetylneuraminic acid mutarotase
MNRSAAAGLVAAVAALCAITTPAVAMSAGGRAGRAIAPAVSSGTWATETPSGLPRREVSYVDVGSMMYLAGGQSPIQQAFDPVSHTWSTVAPLPESLDHIGAVALNGKVYYVGGLKGYPGPSFGNVYVFDPGTNRVTSAAPLPLGRDRGAAGIAVYQGKIYLAGGFHAGASVAFFDVYDPATNRWSALPPLPERRDHVSAAVIGNRMYVIGGRTFGKGQQPQNDAYDFTTRRWITGLAPLPTLRSGAATAVFGTEVVVIGGEGGGRTFNQAEAYNTATNTWRELTPMPTSRHGIQAAMYDGSAYIADGGTKMGGGGNTDVQQVLTVP